jgi:pimeloyl-ACP methyl ester carboxylesterase
MPLRRLLLAPAAALALLLLGAPHAGAALGTTPCSADGFLCDTLAVPLDRTGAVAGQVRLAVARRPAAGVPTREAVVALAGGPGQAATPFATSFASALAPFLGARDLVVFDQRGTGASDPLSCSGFGAAGPTLSGQVRACALELGPARDAYRTVDSAEDLEALRIAGGYERLVLYGVSYGTKVVLTYAARHPQRVAALVLDSVVPADGPDVWNRPSFAALGRVLRDLCADRACRLASRDPRRDLRRLAGQLRRRPLTGTVTAPGGGRLNVELTETGLWQVLLAGDLNPALRAELPGAVGAARRGDGTPILRLRARSRGLTGTAQSAPPNATLFTVTRCSETVFPWSAAAGAGARLAQARTAAGALAAGTFAPFSADVALRASVATLCSTWPDPARSPASGPPPSVPTLVLAGAADLRTPLEEARRVAAGIPGARVLAVPGTGHSVLGSDLGGCVDDELAAFARGETAACTPRPNQFTPTPRPPLRLSELAGRTRARRTVSAVRLTLSDVRRQLIGDAIAAGRAVRSGSRTGGLRGGVATVEGDFVTLARVSYVPGVRVSGTYGIRGGVGSRLAVTGPGGATGRLDISAGGAVSGTLDGRRIRIAAPAARAAGGGRDLLALPLWASPGLRSLG